jgi:hypothetical protein
VWFFPIKQEKENRCDTGPQKLAEPIHPEMRPVRQPQQRNANSDGWVESAPRNLSDGNGLSTGYQHVDLIETRRFITSLYESNRNARLAD